MTLAVHTVLATLASRDASGRDTSGAARAAATLATGLVDVVGYALRR